MNGNAQRWTTGTYSVNRFDSGFPFDSFRTQILDMIFEVMDNLLRYITVINQISQVWRISYQNLPDFSSMLLNFAEL